MEHDFESNFFTMLELLDPASRLEIDGDCTRVSVGADEIIYKQDEESNSIYIVAVGMVEAVTQSPDGKQSRTIGYMRKGDFFGDLGVLTNLPRLATMRSCEPSKLLKFEKIAFLHLLEKVPKMGSYFSRNLARRLRKTSTEAHLSIFSLDLTGNLQHFDLLTIFQAITSMGRSGELLLYNSTNELIGSFFFTKGKAEHARFVHLLGLEAVWQGFVESATEGTFIFRVKDQPTVPFAPEHKIERESTDLLIEGVTRRDTYQAIPESLRQMEVRLSRVATELAWTDEATQPLAERVWELIAKRPQPLDSLWRRLNYSALSFLEIVVQLVETGQAEVLANPPAEAPKETSAPAPPEQKTL